MVVLFGTFVSAPSPFDRRRPLLVTRPIHASCPCLPFYLFLRLYRVIYPRFHKSLQKNCRFRPLASPSLSPASSCLLSKAYTWNCIVSSVSAFIRRTRSNAPTSPIKVCPLLINCGCDHLSTLMVISGITGARFIKQYFI